MTEAPWLPDDPRWEDDEATERYGPTPPPLTRPGPTARGPRGRRGIVAAALTTVGVVYAIHLVSGPALDDDQNGPLPVAIDSSSGCDAPPVERDNLIQQVVGLVEREDRCPSIVSYDRRTATLDLGPQGRYRLGEPGDLLLVGDWDCDGTVTPALYRPSDGRTFQFSAWAHRATVASTRAELTHPNGTPRVERRDGCDHLVVEAPA